MPILYYVICALIGYFVGTVNPSYFMAKFKGFDIREKGSKNCGASNAFLTMGKGAAIICGAIDIGKVFIATGIAMIFFHDLPYFHYVTSFSAVLGHMYPFYLKFKAGKGFASLISCMFICNGWFGLITILIGLVLAGISNYIVSATFTVVIATSIFVPLYTNFALIPTIFSTLVCLIIFVKHIPNIIKIIKKEEFHIYKTKKR